jgi:hypothetical protein
MDSNHRSPEERPSSTAPGFTRRAVIIGALSACATLRLTAQAQNPPAGGPGGDGVPRTIFRLQRRTIEVNGKPASVYGIQPPDSTLS